MVNTEERIVKFDEKVTVSASDRGILFGELNLDKDNIKWCFGMELEPDDVEELDKILDAAKENDEKIIEYAGVTFDFTDNLDKGINTVRYVMYMWADHIIAMAERLIEHLNARKATLEEKNEG